MQGFSFDGDDNDEREQGATGAHEGAGSWTAPEDDGPAPYADEPAPVDEAQAPPPAHEAAAPQPSQPESASRISASLLAYIMTSPSNVGTVRSVRP